MLVRSTITVRTCECVCARERKIDRAVEPPCVCVGHINHIQLARIALAVIPASMQLGGEGGSVSALLAHEYTYGWTCGCSC